MLRTRIQQPQKGFADIHAVNILVGLRILERRHFADQAEEHREEFAVFEPIVPANQPGSANVERRVDDQDLRQGLRLNHAEQLDPYEGHVEEQGRVVLQPTWVAQRSLEYAGTDPFDHRADRAPRTDQ